MKLVITDDVFDLFPDVKLAVVLARGIDNHRGGSEAEDFSSAREAVLASFAYRPITEHPRILCWREAYRAFGAKPKDNPSSIENLVRRVLKGETPRPINKLVDVYNLVSLVHLLPAGGEDLDRVEGDIRLTRASADELPVRLLGEREERPPKPGEVVYEDARGAICRRWNWKEADRTKLTEETRNAVLVLEAIPPITAEELRAAGEDLARRVREKCGGDVREEMLDSGRRELSF